MYCLPFPRIRFSQAFTFQCMPFSRMGRVTISQYNHHIHFGTQDTIRRDGNDGMWYFGALKTFVLSSIYHFKLFYLWYDDHVGTPGIPWRVRQTPLPPPQMLPRSQYRCIAYWRRYAGHGLSIRTGVCLSRRFSCGFRLGGKRRKYSFRRA